MINQIVDDKTLIKQLRFKVAELQAELKLAYQMSSSGEGGRSIASTPEAGTVRVFRQKFTLEDAIGSHACSLEANMRVTNDIPLGCSLLLPVCTVNCVQTLKASGIRPARRRRKQLYDNGKKMHMLLQPQPLLRQTVVVGVERRIGVRCGKVGSTRHAVRCHAHFCACWDLLIESHGSWREANTRAIQ